MLSLKQKLLVKTLPVQLDSNKMKSKLQALLPIQFQTHLGVRTINLQVNQFNSAFVVEAGGNAGERFQHQLLYKGLFSLKGQ